MPSQENFISEQDTEGRQKSHQIYLKASNFNKIIYYSFLVQLLFNLIYIISKELGHERLYGIGKFYFDFEESVPTYFSSIILLLAAILLAIIRNVKSKLSDPFSTHWMIISILFAILSVDEIAGFHEIIIDPINNSFHFSGYWRFSWVIPALIFLLIFIISYLKFLNSLPSKYRKGFIFSGFIYVLGAVGIEMISAKLFINDKSSANDLIYNLVITLEETFEMLGVMIFITVLLSYIKSMKYEISISLK
ncbi:hypothetical protein SAMN05421813_11710 [Daejeonella rubra]|uniref:Uncharacterized protein n=1 Tax=Daejeonella rubra TaxID=990371 RepID=A0A1G9UMR2_9SPHI|nr:hypothetical protein [Daejeonella rubra]SDM61206.1 hypothetical protein SAMN05421813_11710 [Daejeonella rubra]